ncbi:MAG TPA: hypothetical protein VF719_03365 [Abditibacteriaceae bacterium]|jgi:hypothetical protein
MKSYYFKLYADYHQFYVEDASSNPITAASPDFWNERSHRDGFAFARDMVSVGTARYGNVVVTVTIRDDEPDDETESWDHVVDAGIEVPSGTLVVRGCTESGEDAEKIFVAPGHYRLRVFYGNLEVDDRDAEEGDDHYKVVLWPGAWQEPQVLKRFEGNE